ncbi:hypothetical protein NEF87_000909 [Candidatus Lokiarchaeum ossiferum]|uniref:Beta-propeller repeat protein n=1 Tax=Candidatus Lokiarchaeum ossiferum TaxID=2951803 RepID=A0ABY6HQ86_9ARCH|nr:hypothetical protein NEF87_000909 [Candidatus Lokiarchaeum sp. B-35]
MTKKKNAILLILSVILLELGMLNLIPTIQCTPISEDAQNYIYSTYFGGSGKDVITDVAFDSQGNIIIAGGTFSRDLNTSNGYQSEYGGGSSSDIHINGGDGFVFKMNPQGKRIWGTYLGGNSLDVCDQLVIDSNDEIFVTGETQSSNFPTTEDAIQPTYGGGTSDVFITKFMPNGSVQYSSFIGGSGVDSGGKCKIDGSDQLYISFFSASSNLNVTSNAHQTSFGGDYDVYISKFENNLTKMLYGSYFGGSDMELVSNIEVDEDDSLIIIGNIMGGNMPTLNAFNEVFNGGDRDIFISKFSNNYSLEFSTYLGGDQFEDPFGSTIGSHSDIIISGRTMSTDYPTANALQKNFGGEVDGIISVLSSDGQELKYSSHFGGIGWDTIHEVVYADNGKIYGCGVANSNFPLKNAFQESIDLTTGNLVLLQLSNEHEFEFGTYFGDTSDQTTPYGIDYHSGYIVVVGRTRSSSFFRSDDADQLTMSDTEDGFICRIAIEDYMEGKDVSGKPTNLISQTIPGYSLISLGICLALAPMLLSLHKNRKRSKIF